MPQLHGRGVHDPGLDGRFPEGSFLEVLGRLAEPDLRNEAGRQLAELFGAQAAILFSPDPELATLLPGPGFCQVLHGASDWQSFLSTCAEAGEHTGTLIDLEGRLAPVLGCSLPNGAAVVLIRPGADRPPLGGLRAMLPLVDALFRAERRILADEVRVRVAMEMAERSNVLTRALQDMRHRLEGALLDAERARADAKRRADQAEAMTVALETQAKQLHQQAVELQELNEELMERSAEAESARAAAEKANRTKSQFLANMSHELRTPINAVIGYADLLNLGITGPVTQQQQVQLERIRTSSAHLLTLVNDVLDLAKVESGHLKVEFHREPAHEVVAEALALIEGQADAERIVLQNEWFDLQHEYIGDRHRVRQVLVNLLSNAVKFTEAQGRIRIGGGIADQAPEDSALAGSGPWIYLEVEDWGIGMSDDQIEQVFHPFVQVESGHTRTRGGTGLGLTISLQLARLMHGDLLGRSAPGRGSCFTLWLPAAPTDLPAGGAGSETRDDRVQRRRSRG